MAAPGWYPQDDGRERFWNGDQWTDQFRGGVSSTSPSATGSLVAPGWYANPDAGGQGMRYWNGSAWADPPAVHTQPGSGFSWIPVLGWMGRHWIITGIVALFVIGSIGSAFSGADDGGDTTSTTPSPTSSTGSTPSSTSATTSPGSDCPKFPKERLDGLAEGAKKGVTVIPPAVAVPIPEDVTNDGSGIGYTTVPYLAVAVHVKKGADDRIVVIATGVKEGDGLTIDTESAVPFFNWGVDAEQGSPIDEFRDAIFASDAATQALLCLR